MQRRGNGLRPAGHEQSCQRFYYRRAPLCGDAPVFFIVIKRLVAEYVARLDAGVLRRFRADRIALVPLHAIAWNGD
jgi:hypothetical protein